MKLEDRVDSRLLRWFRHMMRMRDGRLVQRVITAEGSGCKLDVMRSLKKLKMRNKKLQFTSTFYSVWSTGLLALPHSW